MDELEKAVGNDLMHEAPQLRSGQREETDEADDVGKTDNTDQPGDTEEPFDARGEEEWDGEEEWEAEKAEDSKRGEAGRQEQKLEGWEEEEEEEEEEALQSQHIALESRLEGIRRRIEEREHKEATQAQAAAGGLSQQPNDHAADASLHHGNPSQGREGLLIQTVVDDDDGGSGEGSGWAPYMLVLLVVGVAVVFRSKLRPASRGRPPRRYDRRSRN